MNRPHYRSTDFDAALAGQRASSTAYETACAALRAQARKTVRAVVKERARVYALAPRGLEAIEEGLSALPPRHLVTALAYLNRTPRRWTGFGGECEAINLRGALLYARYARAIASRNERRAAA